MDPQLRKTLQQIINVATVSSVDAFGQATYGTPVAMQCRLEDMTDDGDNPDREQITTRKRIVVEQQVNKTDRVWLPGDSPTDATLGRQPYQVQSVPDELGRIDHYELIV
jgi:hypothetical protein